jgi:phage host-nuclease inhibitor protein Gam
MARLKPKNSITTKAQADAAMAKLNQIDMVLANWDLVEANAIAAVRDEHQTAQRKDGRPGFEAEKALLVKEIEAWSETARETWETKTQETPFGSFGFRIGNKTVQLIKKTARSFEVALGLLQAELKKYVRQKPEIDKEKILADERSEVLDEAALAKCGLKVDQADEFWIETNASKDLEMAAQKLRAA